MYKTLPFKENIARFQLIKRHARPASVKSLLFIRSTQRRRKQPRCRPLPPGGATPPPRRRKHVTRKLHLRTRVRRSPFPTLERKRQDGPPAALLESPQKIRPGIPILVSPASNVSGVDVRCGRGSVVRGLRAPPRDNSSPSEHRMEAAAELTWRWRMRPASPTALAFFCLVSRSLF